MRYISLILSALLVSLTGSGQIKLLKTITLKGGQVWDFQFDNPNDLSGGTIIFKEKKEPPVIAEIGIGPADDAPKEKAPEPPKIPLCVQTKGGKKYLLQPDEYAMTFEGDILYTSLENNSRTVIRKYTVGNNGLKQLDSIYIEESGYASYDRTEHGLIFSIAPRRQGGNDAVLYTIWNAKFEKLFAFKGTGYCDITTVGKDSIAVVSKIENTRSLGFTLYVAGKAAVKKEIALPYALSLGGSAIAVLNDGYIFCTQQYSGRVTHITKYDKNFNLIWDKTIDDYVEVFRLTGDKTTLFASNRGSVVGGNQNLTIFDTRTGNMKRLIDYRAVFNNFVAKHKGIDLDVLPLCETMSSEGNFVCYLSGYSPFNNNLHAYYLFISDGKKEMTYEFKGDKYAFIQVKPLAGRKVLVSIDNTIKLFSY